MSRRAIVLAVILLAAIGFVSGRFTRADVPAAITNAPQPAVKAAFKVEVVATGLAYPWALQFLPDGRMLVTERGGRMRVIDRQGVVSPPIEGLPASVAINQGGLLDVALDPKFADTRLIYFTFAEPRGSDANGTSVARARLELDAGAARLVDLKIIFRQEPASTGGLHFGSRLAFADDGTLFVTLGERNQRDAAQDLTGHLGKVVRITTDGGFPADNPTFPGTAAPGIWSYGHRNPQSAAIHPTSRKLWTVEHGPRGGDEVNVPEKGRNYGWPVIGYGIDYSGAKLHQSTQKTGMEQPVYVWAPSIAPTGMAFYTGNRFPAWKGNLFVGALAGQHLTRLILDNEKIVAEERLLADLGERIRDVRNGPDGYLYVLTDNSRGRVLRLVPAA